MRGNDEGNPRPFYVGIDLMISETRARQPREEEMKCGTQSADIRMIHRRSHCPRVALLVWCRAPSKHNHSVRDHARKTLAHP